MDTRIEPDLPKCRRVGMVARWQPVHLGHARVLSALCDSGEEAVIGLGSSNRHEPRTPFTVEETSAMIRLVLEGRSGFNILPVPDLDDGPRWRTMVRELFGDLDLFVTANPYVASLLRDTYRLLHPVQLIPREARVAVDGTMVRREMARGDGWKSLVPPAVADFIVSQGLDGRFRREFGLQILAQEAPSIQGG